MPPRTTTAGGGTARAGSDSADTARLAAAVEAVAATVADVDSRSLEQLPAQALRGRVDLFERLSGLAAAGLADTIKALADSGEVEADGASSTAEWIKANTNRSGRDAARVSRLATDLADLPRTRDALASGAITDEAADAIVKAARDGTLGSPAEVDKALAPVAKDYSPDKLRAEIRHRQQAEDADSNLLDEKRQHARRKTRTWRDKDGMWALSSRLPDELGQKFRTALDAFDHPDPKGTPIEERRRPEQRLADALAAMTDAVLTGGLAPGTGGIVRPHLSVIVHADTVSADLADPDADDPHDPSAAPAPDDPRWADLPAGEYPWGGKLSPQAVRRICCDASVSRIVMAGDSQVLDVGQATREWSGPQRRAVNARDRGCRGPSCTRPVGWTSIHHLVWWSNDGPTSVANGLALCHHCHRLIHDRGWTVALDLDTAEATWTSPTGRLIVTTPAHHDDPATGPAADSRADRTTSDSTHAGSGEPDVCTRAHVPDFETGLPARTAECGQPPASPAPQRTSPAPTSHTSGGVPRP